MLRLQQRRHFGRAGKHYPAYAIIGRQLLHRRFRHGRAEVALRQAEHLIRADSDPLRGNERRLLGRFCQHAVTGGQRVAAICPVKIASGKFHGRYRQPGRADGGFRYRNRCAPGPCALMQEIDRLAHFATHC